MPPGLKQFYGTGSLDPARPLFDATSFGLGEDGHTASLVPAVMALKEQTARTAAVIGAKPEPRRTLTFPVLESSRCGAFLVTGTGKKDVLACVLAGDQKLPASRAGPVGDLIWFTNEATRDKHA